MALNPKSTSSRRRRILKFGAAVGGTYFLAPMINKGRFEVFAGVKTTYSKRTMVLMENSLVIDMLNGVGSVEERTKRWLKNPDSFTEQDFKWIKNSGIDVFHPAHPGPIGYKAYNEVLKVFTGLNSLISNKPQYLMRIDSAADLNEIHPSRKVGLVFGMQNSDHFLNVDDVNFFHSIGQRVSQLTYNSRNLIGSGGMELRDGGLSEYGLSIVERMNKVGMTVDVSHCADRTTLDAFEASSKPVAITHSNCRALNPSYDRCKTDEAIKKMAASGGVMGLTTLRAFIRDKDPVTVEHFVDHVDHVVKLVGIEYVGIGSDADIVPYGKKGMEYYNSASPAVRKYYRFRETIDTIGLDHPKRTFDIVEALVRRGYSDRHIELFLGENFKRMLAETWSS